MKIIATRLSRHDDISDVCGYTAPGTKGRTMMYVSFSLKFLQKMNWTMQTRVCLGEEDGKIYILPEKDGYKLCTSGTRSSRATVVFAEIPFFATQKTKITGQKKGNFVAIEIEKKGAAYNE